MSPTNLSRRGAPVSPLRYPGGKAALAGVLSDWCRGHGKAVRYVEPFAGGAAAALSLALSGVASKIQINDLDPAIYSFWAEVTENNAAFCDRVRETAVTLDEWHLQREVYRSRASGTVDRSDLAFAVFFLNRTNRSGVLTGGVIGGQSQKAADKIDARYTKQTLIGRLKAIGTIASRISVTNLDGAAVIKKQAGKQSSYLYIDPPYVVKGGSLYYNSLDLAGHKRLAQTLAGLGEANWILTYDDVPEVRSMYSEFRMLAYPIDYSASRRGAEFELMVLANSVPQGVIDQLASSGAWRVVATH